jgi:hypothetical protein
MIRNQKTRPSIFPHNEEEMTLTIFRDDTEDGRNDWKYMDMKTGPIDAWTRNRSQQLMKSGQEDLIGHEKDGRLQCCKRRIVETRRKGRSK